MNDPNNVSGREPIINCHTHIFTGDHVPPYLAKTFLPWPVYFLVPLSMIVKLFRFWYRVPDRWRFQAWNKNIKKLIYQIKIFIRRSGILSILSFLLGAWLTIQVFFIIYDWFSPIRSPGVGSSNTVERFRSWFSDYGLILIPSSTLGKVLFILLLVLFFKFGRNLLWFVLKKLWSFLGVLPGPQSKALAQRYLNIGRFSFYKEQSRIFGRLKNQYPENTGFVVLPMDMEYMDAGELKDDFIYCKQMAALADMKQKEDYKKILYPFVFAEPRRMVQEGATHFQYTIDNGTVVLEKCFIKQYIEDFEFSGFKIYPALGYYPFDEALLPLWKYAADNGLPILTHCIRGTIFFRGKKIKEWDYHPVFEEAAGEGQYRPMLLSEILNRDFSNNFTHPLNYLCLLDERLLRKLVKDAKDDRIRSLFGYTEEETPMPHNLSHLKICFGHFGGDDEWNRFIESDRDNYSSQLVRKPDNGITFLTDEEGDFKKGKPEQIWKSTDWYSIICSLMLQYPNVYADLSYILHSPGIQPLLKHTLSNPQLRTKVLFGTDFYVVRNHKSEKNMLADMSDHLSDSEFDQIARTNPRVFLSNRLHGDVKI